MDYIRAGRHQQRQSEKGRWESKSAIHGTMAVVDVEHCHRDRLAQRKRRGNIDVRFAAALGPLQRVLEEEMKRGGHAHGGDGAPRA